MDPLYQTLLATIPNLKEYVKITRTKNDESKQQIVTENDEIKHTKYIENSE